MASKINRQFLFEFVRARLFGGSMKQKQVDGTNSLLDYWETNLAANDDRWLAYVLATAYHETAFTMQPIKEFGSNAYFMDRYDKTGSHPNIAQQLGNTDAGDGKKFPGRGFVQVTGRKNYQDWTTRINKPGVDLVANPDQAMDPSVAVVIIFEGMRLGTFTGKKLSDYFNKTSADWKQARRIVNGLDKADIIGGYGRTFYAAISYTTG